MWGREGEERLEGGRESCDNGGVNEGINSGLAMTCVECFRFGGGVGEGFSLQSSLLATPTTRPFLTTPCSYLYPQYGGAVYTP